MSAANLRRTWRSHSNADRVSGWLGSHASFRVDLLRMLEVLNDASRVAIWAVEPDHAEDASFFSSALLMLSSFGASFGDQWIPKLHSHAEFEDKVQQS